MTSRPAAELHVHIGEMHVEGWAAGAGAVFGEALQVELTRLVGGGGTIDPARLSMEQVDLTLPRDARRDPAELGRVLARTLHQRWTG